MSFRFRLFIKHHIMLLVALIITAIFCLIFHIGEDLKTLWRQILLNIPCFNSYPIIGHYYRFHGLNTEEAFVATNEFSLKFPEISKLWQFHHLNIFVNSPRLIEKVLMSRSCLQRPLLLLKFFDINEGLLSSRYGQWTHDRKFINQYFNPKMINAYMSSMIQCVDVMVSKISVSEEVDLLPKLERCALHAVCSTLFGMDVMNNQIDEICARTAEIFCLNSKTFESGLKNPLRFLEIFHRMTSNYKKVKSAQDFLTNLFMKMNFDHRNSDDNSESLLEVLIKSEGEIFTKKQVCEHILTFLNAGLDTTAAHLHYTILFLAMHPECQDNLSKEIKTFFDKNQKIDYDNITKLEYLDRVMKESFRLAPPIFLVGRETVEDFEISPGCVIPKNTSLAINTFVLHRRKDIFGENSNDFDPDHFLPEAVSQRHPFSFQPFSTGRRNCIGYRFGIIFIKLVLLKLIKNFKFTTKSEFKGLRFKYGMTLKLTEDQRVSIEARTTK